MNSNNKTGYGDLAGKVIVITGGSGYLGTEFSKAVLSCNGRVISLDINENREYINDLPADYKERYFFHKVDCLDKDELQDLSDTLADRHGKISGLVNAMTLKHKDFYLPFEEVTVESWQYCLQELTSTFISCQVFIPKMAIEKQGSVINISSIYGMVGNDQRIYEDSNLAEVYLASGRGEPAKRIYSHAVYPAVKGGIIALTKYLAAYYGKDNIRVNTISPGGISHPQENQEFVRRYSEKTPLGRKAKKHELNGALIYLLSDASSYVTGHNLVVDGGWTAW